jgi:hypothetical protein
MFESKRRQPASVLTMENIGAVRVVLQKISTASRDIQTIVQQILKSYLNLKPYKMTVLSKLTVQNKHQGLAFA